MRTTERSTTAERRRTAHDRRVLVAVAAVVAALTLTLAPGPLARVAHAGSFLDQVERGKAAVLGNARAVTGDAATRAAVVDETVYASGGGSAAFALGAALAALNLDLEDGNRGRRGERAAIARQVQTLLRAQAETGIGNRALCLLSGRTHPRSLEAQIRLVEPRWSCGPSTHH
ncbi:MAG TPA: hypothetical protein VIS07_03275 [Candidatus Binatia bacterium]